MNLFEEIYFGHTAPWEGGYVNHPEDPGGATKFGITIKTLSKWRKERGLGRTTLADVHNLTKEQAVKIYRAWYWEPTRCDDLPPALAACVFDTAVNSGPARAIRTLQRAVNHVARTSLAVDGRIGPRTLGSVDGLRRIKKQRELVTEFCAQRMRFYGDLPTFVSFGLGWARRLMALHVLAQVLVGTEQ